MNVLSIKKYIENHVFLWKLPEDPVDFHNFSGMFSRKLNRKPDFKELYLRI